MTDQHDRRGTSDFERLSRVLRRRGWLVILCVIVVGGSALAVTLRKDESYTATASLLFRDPAVDRSLFRDTTGQELDGQRQAATNLKLVSLPEVADRTATALGDYTGAQVAARVEVSGGTDTDVVSVTATEDEAWRAPRLANAFAEQYIAIRREADRSVISAAEAVVQERLGDLGTDDRRTLQSRADDLKILAALQTGKAEIVQRAKIPSSPDSPQPVRNAILGGMLGLVLGIGLALFVDRLDRRLRDPEALAGAFALPVLGSIPEAGRADMRLASVSRSGRRRGLRAVPASGDDGPQLVAGPFLEAFRMLRAKLLSASAGRDVVTVAITSAGSGDGKTTVARELALAAAAPGRSRVMLVEADLRDPSLAGELGLEPIPGLAELLTGELHLDDVVQTITVTGRAGLEAALDVVVAGRVAPQHAELLESRHMTALLQELRDHYDLVLIDTPPLPLVADAMSLMREVDGVVAVARHGASTRRQAQQLRHELTALGARTLGIVVNRDRTRTTGYYGYQPSPAEPPAGAALPVQHERLAARPTAD